MTVWNEKKLNEGETIDEETKKNKLNSEIVQASNNNNSNKNDKSRKNFKFEKKINVKWNKRKWKM